LAMRIRLVILDDPGDFAATDLSAEHAHALEEGAVLNRHNQAIC